MSVDGKATLLAVRAIGAVFGKQIWLNVTIIAGVLALLLVALCVWLISLSAWWWLLAIVAGMAISIAFVMLFVFRAVLNSITPKQNSEQKQAVQEFTKKLQLVKELTETPNPMRQHAKSVRLA
jgi:LPS O-antigen subunit length determinant protein (WzzB/FepE family)